MAWQLGVALIGVGLVIGGVVRGALASVGNPIHKAKASATRAGKKAWNWIATGAVVAVVIWIINARNGAA